MRNLVKSCLNPCYNGIVMYMNMKRFQKLQQSLNPCYNGIVMYKGLYV